MIITLLFNYCKKADTGPMGPAGAPGPAGPAGSQGPKGDSGTVNVIASAWLDVTYSADTIHIASEIDTIGFYANITADKLSNAIISNGEMKVYINKGTSTNPDVFILPYSDPSGLSIIPEFFIQRIHLYANANLSTYTSANSKYYQYRYIFIPATINARLIQQTIDWEDYEKVKAYLYLKD
jgi:hypothetical protein